MYYAWQYIEATSFVVDGTRFYVLFDDAMISMRYARNLAQTGQWAFVPGQPSAASTSRREAR